MRLLFELIGAIVFVYVFIVFVYDTIYIQSILRPSLKSDIEVIKDYIKDQDIKFPNVVLAQVIHETGWLGSALYLEQNNCFGMTCHTWGKECICRDTNRKDVDGTYCDYEDRYASIRDYAEWQIIRFATHSRRGLQIPRTEEEYLQFLKTVNYATDKKYIEKVKKYIHYSSTVSP